MASGLRDIEARKRTFGPGTPEFLALAQQIDDLTKIVFDIGHRQFKASQVAVAAGAGKEPIDSVRPPRSATQIIEEWREAERRLSFAVPDSREFIDALSDAEALRAEYKSAVSRLDETT